MKILLFSSFATAWNAARPEAELFIGIAEKGHPVFVATQAIAPYVERFTQKGLKVFNCYPGKKICMKTIRHLRWIIQSHDIDIVYATNSKTIPNAAFACMGLSVRLITYRGTSRGLYRHDPGAYLTHLHPRVDGISCNARAVQQDVSRRVWKSRDRVQTIYKGHDTRWFSNSRANLGDFAIPAGAFVATCIANARPSKGVPVLLAATWLLKDLKDLYILVVGENVDSPEYAAIRSRSPMASNIILSGYRTDVPAIIAASSLYIQPSISREGMAKTVIEAMAQGIPAVVTDAGGTHELIEEGKSGYVVPAGSSRDIADRIRMLHRSPEQLSSMGRAAKKRIEKKFSVQNSVNETLAFFQRILEAPPD